MITLLEHPSQNIQLDDKLCLPGFGSLFGECTQVDPSTVIANDTYKLSHEGSLRVSKDAVASASEIDSPSKSELSKVDWIAHWNTRMQGLDSEANAAHTFPYDFVYDYSENAQRGNLRETLTTHIPVELTDSLHKISSDNNTNPLYFLVAAFGLLISKHTNNKETVIGALPEAASIPVPLRMVFGHMIDTPSVEALRVVNKVKTEMNFINKYAKKYRDSNAIMEMLNAVTEGDNALEADFWRILVSTSQDPEAMNSYEGVVDLALAFTNNSHQSFTWTFNPNLFLAETIARIHDRMVNLLSTICKVEGCQAMDQNALSLFDAVKITSAEEDRILEQYSMGKQRYVQTVAGLHVLFEQQADTNGPKTAVEDEFYRSLTYSQLNAQSTSLSILICSISVTREEFTSERRVAVMIHRSLTMFVALLGVLKAGAAYVPIDPTYTADRIQYILEDSGADLVLTDISTQILVPADFVNRTYCLPDVSISPICESENDNIVIPKSSPEKLFCVLYTSGTTGKPKGVGIEHKNALTFMENSLWDPINEKDVWAQMANQCFIGSMNDIWLPLIRGATTSIIPKGALMDVNEFTFELRRRGVTCTFMTPKMLELYADSDPATFEGLNVVQVAGEAVRLDAVVKLAGRAKHLQHLYGCTERTGCISGYEVPADGVTDTLKRCKRLTIGKPIENTSMYILDERMNAVPIGVVGQLYVGGDQIARGYLNRDDLTKQKFITDASGRGRLYATGDLARWLPDGTGVDLIGRTDSMVKIRGYRVELGEIEAAIMNGTEEGITASSVIIREDSPGNQTLVAYVAPASVSTKNIHAQLIGALPAYMVPVCIIAINQIPLNHNAKVDKRALPVPTVRDMIDCATECLEPCTTEAEKEVVRVWSEVIKVNESVLGANSIFTEVGGNSLHVAMVLTSLRSYCQSLELSDILLHDSPRAIGALMDSLRATESVRVELPDPILKFAKGDGSNATPVFLIHGGSGLVDYGALIGQYVHKRAFYGIQLTESVANITKAATANGDDALTVLSTEYVKAVKLVHPHGPYAFSGNSLGALLAFEMTRILEADGEVVERVIPMDMPVFKFNKMDAYATATDYSQKAPMLLAYVWGHHFSKNTEYVDHLLAEMDRKFLKQLEEFRSTSEAADALFTQMDMTMSFLLDLGMPKEQWEKVIFGLTICDPLFVDIRDRGTIKADVELLKCKDNRLMEHTCRFSGNSHLLEYYGWDQVTSGIVTVGYVPGNHVDMVSVGMKECAAIFDY
eukprot:CFRG3994T1